MHIIPQRLDIHEFTVKDLTGGIREVTAVISNTRLIPTHSGIDLEFGIERPDYVTLEGAEIISGMIVHNRDLNIAGEQIFNPSRLEVPNIPGNGFVTVRWLVKGGRRLTISVDSAKGGRFTRDY
jgi:hypothetical protein